MGVPVGISPDDDVYNGKYLELCKGLNLDKNAAGRAWETYLTVKENYSLDVSRPHPSPRDWHADGARVTAAVPRWTYRR